jgi:hypothetical protein
MSTFLVAGGRIPSSVRGIVSMGPSMDPKIILQFEANPKIAEQLTELSRFTGRSPSELLNSILSSPRIQSSLRLHTITDKVDDGKKGE